MRFMASIPVEAMQTPAVPPKMIRKADGWMNAVGMVPSITPPPRRPKMASPIPMAEAAFMGVQMVDRRLTADLHRARAPLDALVRWNAPARMPARQSRTASTTASTLSVTTTFVPVVSAMCVSGVASTITIRSGFRMKGALSAPRRCSWIMALSDQFRSGLALHADQVLEHLVRGRDDPGVGLEATLGGDEVGELAGEVHVRHLDRAGGRDAERAVLARGADVLDARVHARAPLVAGQALEAVLVGELGQRDVAAGRAAVRDGGQRGRLDVARRRDEAHRAVAPDGHVGGARGDVDVAVLHAGDGGAADDVVARAGDQVALVVAREVARARVGHVGDRRRGRGRVARRRGAGAGAEPAVALDGDVERVAGGLDGAAGHQVVDRAQRHAEADLRRVGAAEAGARV